jgi:GNAT superfamily N-acetyltransferase
MSMLLAAEVWSAVRRDLANFMAHLEPPATVLQDDAVLVLTGGPTADFNFAIINASPNAAPLLRECARRVDAAGVPALFMLPSAIAADLAPVAVDAGLSEAGTAPLMYLDRASITPDTVSFQVHRVEDAAQMQVVADLIASAFALDREWVARTFAAPWLLGAPGVEFWIATTDAEPCSAVTCLRSSPSVGIWSMATAPEHQRKGAGRALLQSVLRRYRDDCFYLIATPPGKPLYDALGFTTIDDVAVWTMGHSEQFAQH